MRGKTRSRGVCADPTRRRIPYARGQNVLATAILALYAIVMLMLALVPVSLVSHSMLSMATLGEGAGRAISYGNSYSCSSPFGLMALALDRMGIRPQRTPWQSNGVDYGNTRTPRHPAAAPITMTWEYRPLRLEAVPPGVNVLAPTWFYVQQGDDGAEVVDLFGVNDQTITKWDPAQYVAKAHEEGAQVWGVVVSFEPEISKQIVTDPVRQRAFIERLARWVEQHDLDGINFDFEKMDPDDEKAFTALVAATKAGLPADCVVSVCVTVPIPKPDPNNWWQCYDRQGLGQVADYVAVMTYDSSEPGPVAGIDWVQSKLRAMLDLVPEEKLLMGVPFYGVDFRFALDGCLPEELPRAKDADSRRTLLPSQLNKLLSTGIYTSSGKPVAVEQWVDRGTWVEQYGMTRYVFIGTDDLLHLIYCEDEQSLRLKGGLMGYNRLAGVAVWRMGYGNESLWQAMGEGMAAK